MSEELLVTHCSPTLAGLKTGSLFICEYSTERELIGDLSRLNSVFVPKGLRIVTLRLHDGKALLYLYRPQKLSQDLKNDVAKRLLVKNDYHCRNSDECVVKLRQRLKHSDEFPHEIGLFLGYPPEDVCGFIENHAENFKLVGCWKVYGDVEKAKKTFAKYKKCTDVYKRQYKSGKSVERLTVAV